MPEVHVFGGRPDTSWRDLDRRLCDLLAHLATSRRGYELIHLAFQTQSDPSDSVLEVLQSERQHLCAFAPEQVARRRQRAAAGPAVTGDPGRYLP